MKLCCPKCKKKVEPTIKIMFRWNQIWKYCPNCGELLSKENR